jgi:hypothetical protein
MDGEAPPPQSAFTMLLVTSFNGNTYALKQLIRQDGLVGSLTN